MGTPSSTQGIEGICSLPAEDREARLAMIQRDILPLATERERLPDGIRFVFPYRADLERTLEDLVAFERGCCGSLSWEAAREGKEHLRLSVRGLPAGSDLLALAEGGRAATPRFGRLARSLGLGSGLALVVCCVLPLAVSAVAGAAIAAPLAGLDQPLVIAAVALGSAGLTWRWLGRGATGARPGY